MQTISLRQSVIQQLNRTLQELSTLEASEFPYPDARGAAVSLKTRLLYQRNLLQGLAEDDDGGVADNFCSTIFSELKELLPIIGFILRATNVRNAFEVRGPLLRHYHSCIGDNVHLLLSSEWEYSPHAFLGCSQLPNYVLVGLPATESSNPFLLPLAAHELGHAIWRKHNFEARYRPRLQKYILQEIENNADEYISFYPGRSEVDLLDAVSPALNWACQQAEETFCDFTGLHLFGESYLHACSYLLAPHRHGPRSYRYPNHQDRSHAMVLCAKIFGLRAPDNFVGLFRNLGPPAHASEKAQYLLKLADTSRSTLLLDLVDDVKLTCKATKAASAESTEVYKCYESFKLMIPAEDSGGIANIINAGWLALLENNFFQNSRHDADKEMLLSEIILKSIEILEIEYRRKDYKK